MTTTDTDFPIAMPAGLRVSTPQDAGDPAAAAWAQARDASEARWSVSAPAGSHPHTNPGAASHRADSFSIRPAAPQGHAAEATVTAARMPMEVVPTQAMQNAVTVAKTAPFEGSTPDSVTDQFGRSRTRPALRRIGASGARMRSLSRFVVGAVVAALCATAPALAAPSRVDPDHTYFASVAAHAAGSRGGPRAAAPATAADPLRLAAMTGRADGGPSPARFLVSEGRIRVRATMWQPGAALPHDAVAQISAMVAGLSGGRAGLGFGPLTLLAVTGDGAGLLSAQAAGGATREASAGLASGDPLPFGRTAWLAFALLCCAVSIRRIRARASAQAASA